MANQYRSVLASSGPAPTGGDALPAEVLAGKTFTNDNGAQTGTMVNRGAVSQTLNAGESYTIPAGYHNGSGVVTASSPSFKENVTLASDTPATITGITSDTLIITCGCYTNNFNLTTSDATISRLNITPIGNSNLYLATFLVTNCQASITINSGANSGTASVVEV